MILNRIEIETLVLAHSMIEGYQPEHLSNFSLSVTAGPSAFMEVPAMSHNPVPLDGNAENLYTVDEYKLESSALVVPPGGFVTIYCEAVFKMPARVMGRCYSVGTPSLRGFGMASDVILQPGWEGRLLLPFKNLNLYHSVVVKRGDILGQVQFHSVPPQESPILTAGKLHNLGATLK